MVRLVLVWLVLSLPSAGTSLASEQATYTPTAPNVVYRGVQSAAKEKLDHFFSVAPGCKFLGYPRITVTTAPLHGSARAEIRDDYPNYPPSNVRFRCNRKLTGSSQIFYESYPNYHGRDSFTIKVVFPDGLVKAVRFVVEVL